MEEEGLQIGLAALVEVAERKVKTEVSTRKMMMKRTRGAWRNSSRARAA